MLCCGDRGVYIRGLKETMMMNEDGTLWYPSAVESHHMLVRAVCMHACIGSRKPLARRCDASSPAVGRRTFEEDI